MDTPHSVGNERSAGSNGRSYLIDVLSMSRTVQCLPLILTGMLRKPRRGSLSRFSPRKSSVIRSSGKRPESLGCLSFPSRNKMKKILISRYPSTHRFIDQFLFRSHDSTGSEPVKRSKKKTRARTVAFALFMSALSMKSKSETLRARDSLLLNSGSLDVR